MHTAYFRFYEELNDFLTAEKRKVRFSHRFIDRASVKDMIESLGVPHIEIDLILVNGKSVNFSYIVNDGDDISVYPVFESFDISEVQHLRTEPLREPKFIFDVHLGKLAKFMRLLGFDSAYKNDFSDDELVQKSLDERRTILTKDRDLLKRSDVAHGYWIRSRTLKDQLEEIINRFQLKNKINLFSRCLICNSLLQPIEKEKVADRIPPKVKELQTRFSLCQNCDKVYWKGTHYENMKNVLDNLTI